MAKKRTTSARATEKHTADESSPTPVQPVEPSASEYAAEGFIEAAGNAPSAPPDPAQAAQRIGKKRARLGASTVTENSRHRDDDTRPPHQVLRLLADDIDRTLDDCTKNGTMGVVVFTQRVDALLVDVMNRADRVLLDRLDDEDHAEELVGILRPVRERIRLLGQVARGWSGELGRAVRVPSERPPDDALTAARARVAPKPDGTAPDAREAQWWAMHEEVWGTLDELRAMGERLRDTASGIETSIDPTVRITVTPEKVEIRERVVREREWTDFQGVVHWERHAEITKSGTAEEHRAYALRRATQSFKVQPRPSLTVRKALAVKHGSELARRMESMAARVRLWARVDERRLKRPPRAAWFPLANELVGGWENLWVPLACVTVEWDKETIADRIRGDKRLDAARADFATTQEALWPSRFSSPPRLVNMLHRRAEAWRQLGEGEKADADDWLIEDLLDGGPVVPVLIEAAEVLAEVAIPWDHNHIAADAPDRLDGYAARLRESAEEWADKEEQVQKHTDDAQTGGESAGPAIAKGDEEVLRAMAGFDPSQLLSVERIREKLPFTITDEPVRRIVVKLIESKLAERPEGEKRGARLTSAGRALAGKIVE